MTTAPDGLFLNHHQFLLDHSDVSQDLLAPAQPANESQLRAAEAALGVVFDDEYRTALLSADGWPDLEGMAQFYGSADYLSRPRGPSNLADNLIPDAIHYFDSEEFDDPTESVVSDRAGYRSVVVGRSTVSSQFFVMRFAIDSRQPRSAFYDCMHGEDAHYDGIGAWFDEQREIVLNEG